ncbi:hypothetical protein [Luethyella okanaganae]|uniref:Uncharacterized protein n=1 Tax=Luethyella okanaganae TaxID=69372 RepID=A0ABW1VK37_9MICO
MSLPSAEEARSMPIVTDDEVEARVAALIGSACRRQFWMLFIDGDDRQLPLIMPVADYPTSPAGGRAELLASRIKEIVDLADAAQVIFVWERRLAEASTQADRAWASALGDACRAEGVSVRAQLISHRSGVRWFPPDDYL